MAAAATAYPTAAVPNANALAAAGFTPGVPAGINGAEQHAGTPQSAMPQPNALGPPQAAAAPPAPVDPYATEYATQIAAARAAIAQTLTTSLAGIQAHQNAANGMIGGFAPQMNALGAATDAGIRGGASQATAEANASGGLSLGSVAGATNPMRADTNAQVAGTDLATRFAAGAAPLMTQAEGMQTNALRSEAQQQAAGAQAQLAETEAGYANSQLQQDRQNAFTTAQTKSGEAFTAGENEKNRTTQLTLAGITPGAATAKYGTGDVTPARGQAIATTNPAEATRIRSEPAYNHVVSILRGYGAAWVKQLLGDPALQDRFMNGNMQGSPGNGNYTTSMTPEVLALAIHDAGY